MHLCHYWTSHRLRNLYSKIGIEIDAVQLPGHVKPSAEIIFVTINNHSYSIDITEENMDWKLHSEDHEIFSNLNHYHV